MTDALETFDPLARARGRGRRYAVEEYAESRNLTLSRASDLIRLSPEAIRALHVANQLYRLPDPSGTGVWRYPQWQFNAQPLRLACLLQMFAESNRWALHSFMMGRREALDGKSPAEAILDEATDIQLVVNLALMVLQGEQGAI